MEIFTISFTQTPAAGFFPKLKRAGVRCPLDAWLHSASQLATCATRNDLRCLLREIRDVEYEHKPLLAATDKVLNGTKSGSVVPRPLAPCSVLC
jgi:hypothetical protein